MNQMERWTGRRDEPGKGGIRGGTDFELPKVFIRVGMVIYTPIDSEFHGEKEGAI